VKFPSVLVISISATTLGGCGGSSGSGGTLTPSIPDKTTHYVCGASAGRLQPNAGIDDSVSAVEINSAEKAANDFSARHQDIIFKRIFTDSIQLEASVLEDFGDYYCSADRYSENTCNLESDDVRVTTTVSHDRYTSEVEHYNNSTNQFEEYAIVRGTLDSTNNMSIEYTNGDVHSYSRSTNGTEQVTATNDSDNTGYSMTENPDCSGSYTFSDRDKDLSVAWEFNGSVTSGYMTYREDGSRERTVNW